MRDRDSSQLILAKTHSDMYCKKNSISLGKSYSKRPTTSLPWKNSQENRQKKMRESKSEVF